MKKFLIILYILIFVALTYYVINLFIDRNQGSEKQVEIKYQSEVTDNTITDAKPPIIQNEETKEISDEQKQKDAAYTITQEDCADECVIIEDTDKQIYCKQVCGLTTTEQDESCDKLNGLAKDYCLRDEAVVNKELSECNKITDSGVKKQCINRINEDFIDEIM